MTSSNIKSWWHSFQLSVEWWKFSDHNVFHGNCLRFGWQCFLFTSWWAFIFDSWWCMALEIQSPSETRNVALDNIIFTVNSLSPNFFHASLNWEFEYWISHFTQLYTSSLNLKQCFAFFTGCFWREDKTLPLQCKQQLLFTVLFRWLHVYLGNTPVNIWVYLLAFFWCVVVNFSVL